MLNRLRMWFRLNRSPVVAEPEPERPRRKTRAVITQHKRGPARGRHRTQRVRNHHG